MRLSYVHGLSDEPLKGETVGGCFDASARRFPDREALVVAHQDVHWSYAELSARVDAFAAGLLSLGLEPGARVGVWAPNCAEWVVAQFATAKAGLVLVNINPAYRLAELEFAVNRVGCEALIVAPRLKSSDYIAMIRELCPGVADSEPGQLRCERLPTLRWLIRLGDETSPGFLNFDQVAERADNAHREALESTSARLQFDDPINIQFTSGTTGQPKAATLTHHNIVNNAFFVGRQMALSERDRVCIPVPMYHCFGMVLGTLCCVAHGATMVFASESFVPGAVLATVAAERCTALHGVPTMFIAELDEPGFEEFDLSSLRTGIMAGAPCPVELMKRVMADMHLEQITIAYGMTETGPVSFQTHVDDSLERRVQTVGRVLPHIEIKIVDDEGRIVPRGTAGELKTRGYCVMPGYWTDPERTAQAIDSARWIASGDIASIDEDGYCRIVGRVKDMLIRGGENIYPREIEEFLYTHPKIDEVEVIGVPDPKYGEEVCAWIKLHEGEQATAEEIREYCKGRIAHFKIPRYIKFVDAFPMTVTGKVQKFVMREQMKEELEASGQT
ncbi:MAG: AMP-binding protein [Gammaproteobacteria bacterium]|nr:AMP-binding protein [Gammaproteobacteria bacterium]NIM72639.1 AMP-binding protein [Gammaproteobacteria bacterium]NIN37696.1 AMP-binding protein [Gammaproteobacteria bacterium]NIO24400.1 AMP-binding protein [Gammaproteobacteria bacterium]NIO65003.1 AMP-binding protein [Gammaproteobacteria bacterium]